MASIWKHGLGVEARGGGLDCSRLGAADARQRAQGAPLGGKVRDSGIGRTQRGAKANRWEWAAGEAASVEPVQIEQSPRLPALCPFHEQSHLDQLPQNRLRPVPKINLC